MTVLTISDFYKKDGNGNVIKEGGQPLYIDRPADVCSDDDVLRILGKLRPMDVVDGAIQRCIEGAEWLWFDDYQHYLDEKADTEEWNSRHAGEPDPTKPDETLKIRPLPTPPIANITTVDDWKNKHKSAFNDYLKRYGVEIDGVRVSLTAEDQNGLAAIKAAFDMQVSAGLTPGDISFHFENGAVVTLSYATFSPFALKFMSERQKFF